MHTETGAMKAGDDLRANLRTLAEVRIAFPGLRSNHLVPVEPAAERERDRPGPSAGPTDPAR